MYTLRLTRDLLDRFEAVDDDGVPEVVPPTTRLGDWYVKAFDAASRRLLLCTSERSLLSIVLPADDLADLPERLVTALVGVLHRLGVPRDAIVAEVDAMTIGGVGAVHDGATLGSMRGLAARARAFVDASPGDVDVAALYTHLGEYRRRGSSQTAAARAVSLLTARAVAARPATREPRNK
jgi:hypothetical protein